VGGDLWPTLYKVLVRAVKNYGNGKPSGSGQRFQYEAGRGSSSGYRNQAMLLASMKRKRHDVSGNCSTVWFKDCSTVGLLFVLVAHKVTSNEVVKKYQTYIPILLFFRHACNSE